MLREELVARVALIISIAGVAAVIGMEQLFQPQQTKIAGISENMAGKKVVIAGMIEWAKEKNNTIVFGITDGSKIKCILFSGGKNAEKIFPKKFVVVEGTVEMHENELVIIAKRLRDWK